VLWW